MNADGGDLKPLLSPPPNTPHFDGHWSPDGKRIAYISNRAGGFDVYVQPVE